MKTYTFNCDGTDCKAGRELLAKMLGLWEAEERRIVNATPLSAEQNELFGFVDAEYAPFSAGFGVDDGYKVTPIGRWICQTAEDGTQFWTVITPSFYFVRLPGHTSHEEYAEYFASHCLVGGEFGNGHRAYVNKHFRGNGGTYGEDTFLYFDGAVLPRMLVCAEDEPDGLDIRILPAAIASSYYAEGL